MEGDSQVWEDQRSLLHGHPSASNKNDKTR